MESVDLAVFSWGAYRITPSLFTSFISPGATIIELIIDIQVFLDKREENCRAFLLKRLRRTFQIKTLTSSEFLERVRVMVQSKISQWYK